jgi:hypothetical protein
MAAARFQVFNVEIKTAAPEQITAPDGVSLARPFLPKPFSKFCEITVKRTAPILLISE